MVSAADPLRRPVTLIASIQLQEVEPGRVPSEEHNHAPTGTAAADVCRSGKDPDKLHWPPGIVAGQGRAVRVQPRCTVNKDVKNTLTPRVTIHTDS